MADFLAIDKGLKRVLMTCNLLKDKLGLQQIVQCLLVLALLHIVYGFEICCVALNLNERYLIHGTIGKLEELGGGLAGFLESLDIVNT